MSITGLSSARKNSFHRRNNSSGELDVFEAAKYFSHDHNRHYNNNIPTRMSLDLPIMRNPIVPPDFRHAAPSQKQAKLENKKYKQPPRSPSGRLASFLNSLFNQTPLNKKKKSKPAKSLDDENTPGADARRKRRSSISHFRIITNTANTEINTNNFKTSGLTTPPPYADTPTKSYKAVSLMPDGKSVNSRTTLHDEITKGTECAWAPGKRTQLDSGFGNDGADSDSSSDLFDLPNHELDFYSSGLPVYETTHIDRIKIVWNF